MWTNTIDLYTVYHITSRPRKQTFSGSITKLVAKLSACHKTSRIKGKQKGVYVTKLVVQHHQYCRLSPVTMFQDVLQMQVFPCQRGQCHILEKKMRDLLILFWLLL